MSSQHDTDWQGLETSDGASTAPEFELPGTEGSKWSLHRPTDYTSQGVGVLGFYPSDSLDDAESLTWLQFTEGVEVVVVTDARYGTLDLEMSRALESLPLVCDPEASVANDYGIDYGSVASCRVFMINDANEIVRTWPANPDPKEIHATALEQVETREPILQRGDE